MFNLKISGFRCNEETDGTGSDAIGIFLATLPVRKSPIWPSSWSYAEGKRDYRVRWAGDMDTGEAFAFQYPMSINQGSSDYDALEVIMIMFEIDGGSSTKSQALEEHWTMRENIERDFQAGVNLGSFPGSSGSAGSYKRVLPWVGWDTNEAFGAGEDIIGLDLWHIDLERPLNGSISWNDYIGRSSVRWTPDLERSYLQRYHSIERDLYKNPRSDGSLSETRSYRSNAENSRYTFEVEYTDI
ncbi:MAG: hypothetical protein Mars2KO_17060 [Maribacter sp.]